MVKCSKCGAENDSYTAFCQECGEIIINNKENNETGKDMEIGIIFAILLFVIFMFLQLRMTQ